MSARDVTTTSVAQDRTWKTRIDWRSPGCGAASPPADDTPDEAVRLYASHKKRANEAIKEMLPPDTGASGEEQTIEGVFRGLSLDRSWLEVRSADGSAKKIRTGPDELDDVIGPMVNRKVRARVRHARGSRSPQPRLVDIETLED
jgi:hypothetical protein